jgi:acetyl-CoA acetyltransferase
MWADEYKISRADQGSFALASQRTGARAQQDGIHCVSRAMNTRAKPVGKRWRS